MPYFQYPLGRYAQEQPIWMNFYVSKYSVKNIERTKQSVQTRSFNHIKLPMPREIGFSANHDYGQGYTPLDPTNAFNPNIANNGGRANSSEIRQRELGPANFSGEYQQSREIGTFRRFSNITELTLVSEARKKYAFEYLLAPKNKEESEAVEDICGTFRKCSYPVVADGLPERTYPQNLWVLKVTGQNSSINYSGDFLGDPLVCVLKTVAVKKNEKADPVIRLLPNGYSNITLLGLVFEEFETGSYDPTTNEVLSKSEISAREFGYNP